MTNNIFRVFLGIAAATLLASTASANLLSNAGFEDQPFAGAEQAGAGDGWTGFSNFGGPFRIQCPGVAAGSPCIEPIGSSTGAHEGSVVLKGFGQSGAFQDFDAIAGETYSGDVWALNPANADIMTNSQIAFALIIFFDAGGAELGATASNVLTSADATDEWNLLSVIATAPTNTASVRFQVMTDSNGDGGGAPRFDDASFQVVPIPGAILLLGSGLMGLVGFSRKKAA